MVIVVRVLGLILCAMAVQFILTGFAISTVDLVRHESAHPYQPRPAATPAPPPEGPRR